MVCYAGAENPDDLTPAEWQAHGAFFECAFEILSQHASWMAWRAAQVRAVAGEYAQALASLQRLAESGTMPLGWDTWLQEGWRFAGLQREPG